MSPEARKVAGFTLLAFLALPTGLCSMANTPGAIGSIWEHDALARGIGRLALFFSSVGWVICGLSIWGAIRLLHRKAPDAPPRDPTGHT
jgi:hypothetical protein